MANNQDIGTMVLEGLAKLPEYAKELEKWAFRNNPVARGARVAGAASTYIPGQEGEGMRVIKQMYEESKKQKLPQGLNPMQENVVKTVQKVQSKNVEKAMEAGASGEQVLKDAGISAADIQPQPKTNEDGSLTGEQLNLSLAGVQPPELNNAQQDQEQILKNLMDNVEHAQGGAFSPGGNAVGKDGKVTITRPGWMHRLGYPQGTDDIATLSRLQKLKGDEPFQKGEKEKMSFAGAIAIKKELAAAGSVDALTPENAGKFQLLSEGFQATDRIDQLLGDNVTAEMRGQGVPSFLKSQHGRLLEAAIEVAVQDRTRIETGAALQPSELESTKKRFMPRKGDAIETALTRLKPLYDYFGGAMNIADPTGTHRQRAKGMNSQQVSAKITSFKEIK